MATELTNRGFTLFNMGRFGEAQPVFEEALSLTPDDPDALLGAAICHTHFGNHQRARELASLAAPHCVLDIGRWHTYSNVISTAGTKEQAYDVAREGIRLFPNYAVAHQNLAISAVQVKKKDDAFAASNRAVELAPNDADVFVTCSYVASSFGKWKEAEHACRTALEIDPNNESALQNLSIALQNQRKRREAIEISSRLAANTPDDQQVVNNAKSQLRGYVLPPVVYALFEAYRIAFVRPEFDLAAIVPAIGGALMVLGFWVWWRMRKLADREREIACRFYGQHWYGSLLASPIRTLKIGTAIWLLGSVLLAVT